MVQDTHPLNLATNVVSKTLETYNVDSRASLNKNQTQGLQEKTINGRMNS